MGREKCVTTLTGKLEVKSWCGYKNNTKIDGKEIRHQNVDWMHLAQDRDQWWGHANTVNETSGSIKGGEFLEQLSDCQLCSVQFKYCYRHVTRAEIKSKLNI
jgi:hypothetical protein